MERFIVRESDGRTLGLYYCDIDEARKKHPDAEITIDTDKTFLESVERIKFASRQTLYDYRGRAIWKIPHNNAYILYRQFVDDNGKYIDGCEYQRWDNITSTNPIGWNITTPKEFEALFIKQKPEYNHHKPVISLKELKRKKAKKFYSKNGKSYWRDADGLFYKAEKYDLPNTAKKEEYKRFKDNTEAVYVRYGSEVAFSKREWFDSMENFLEFFNNEKKNHPAYLGDLEYEVLKHGYKLVHPDDRKVIIALPYIDIDTEIRIAKRDTANENSVARTVTRIWCNQMDGIRFFGHGCGCVEWVEDIVKKYMELA